MLLLKSKKSFYSILHILEIMLRIWALQYRLVGDQVLFFSPLSVIRANPAPSPPWIRPRYCPRRPKRRPRPRTRPREGERRRGVAARGPKHAKQQSEDEIFLSVLKSTRRTPALIFCVDEYPNAKDGSVMPRPDCAAADGKPRGHAAPARVRRERVREWQVTKDTAERELGKVIQRFPYNSPTMGLHIMYLATG